MEEQLQKIKAKKLRIEPVKVLKSTEELRTVVVTPTEFVGGFIDFIREKAVVGLAVAFVVGQQVQGFIKQFIASFIDPAFKLLFGDKLTEKVYTYHGATFEWGKTVSALLNFLFVILTIYAIVKLFHLDKLDKPKDKDEKPKKGAKKKG